MVNCDLQIKWQQFNVNAPTELLQESGTKSRWKPLEIPFILQVAVLPYVFALYIYVCVYIHIYIYIVCEYIWSMYMPYVSDIDFAHTYAFITWYSYACIFMIIYTCIYIYIYRSRLGSRKQYVAYICIYVYICMYTYIYI